MNEKFKHVTVYSMGDSSNNEWDRLLKLLEDGYEIVSTANDEYCIHYILKVPVGLGE